MTDLFFYGTLRYPPLLDLVLGAPGSRLDFRPAELPDHAVRWAEGEAYPMIVPEPGATARGVLVRGLGAGDIERLNFYEGGFAYDLRRMRLRSTDEGVAEAEVYFPPTGDGAPRPGAPWSLEDWAAQWGALTLRAAEEVMAYYGRLSASEVAARFPAVRRRAWSWLTARARPGDPLRDLAQDVKVLSHARTHLNFYGTEEMDLQFRRHDGAMNAPVNRSALMAGEAVVVLPYDPVRDCVLLVEQFRAPVFMAGDPSPWVWEPVAGLIDPLETPEQAARREAVEEAGLTLRTLEPVGKMYSSTGSSGEFLYLFIGLADLGGTLREPAGVASEGEDIVSRILSFDDLMLGVDTEAFRDMPLVTSALWLARHRDRLRNGA